MTLERRSKAMMLPKAGKIIMLVVAILFVMVGIKSYKLYLYTFKPAVVNDCVLLIPTGSSYADVEKLVTDEKVVEDIDAFRWVSNKKKYTKMVKPGRYKLAKGINANQLVNILRIGNQTPVSLTFNNVRTWEDLAGKVSKYLEADSVTFFHFFTNAENANKFGFSNETFMAMFIPNTYEFYWNTTPENFSVRMKAEYEKFWTADKLKKAEEIGLSKLDVSTLASIIQEESNKKEELPLIAGVYINRLKRNMYLQACPTVKFAVGDFTLRRITTEMTEISSPYNTYKNIGLPPGPITFPEVTALDAVLNAKSHNYLYFCAKDDFSGYNVFSRTLDEHNRNAAKYQRELNKNKIWK